MSKIILDLCGGTGAWSEPYRAAGYDVRLVTLPNDDVRSYVVPAGVHGVLAAPPCTEFAVSGARWWKSKPPERLQEALDVVSACYRIIAQANPAWWALENPVGRLKDWIGPYRYTFHPWEYGDPWTKRTCIWGDHVRPPKTPVKVSKKRPSYGNRNRNLGWKSGWSRLRPDELIEAIRLGMLPQDWIHRLGPCPERSVFRSLTPPGWARAFFAANP